MNHAENNDAKADHFLIFHPFNQQHTASLRDEFLAFLISHDISIERVLSIHQPNALGFSFLPNRVSQIYAENEINSAKTIADDLASHISTYRMDGKEDALWVLLDMSWLNHMASPYEVQIELMQHLKETLQISGIHFIFHFNFSAIAPALIQKSFALYPYYFWQGQLIKNMLYIDSCFPIGTDTISDWFTSVSNLYLDLQQAKEGNIYFHTAFENFPHPVVEADYSAIMDAINNLKVSFPENWRSLLETDLQYTVLLISTLSIVHANQPALEWMGAKEEKDFLSALPAQPSHLLLGAFQNHILQLAEGKFPITLSLDMISLTGRDINLFLDVIPLEKNRFNRMLLISQSSNDSLIRGLLERSLYKISQLVNSHRDLQSLYSGIHEVLNQFINAKNFYIALHRPEDNAVEFVYHVDELDHFPGQVPLRDGKTEFVIRSGETLWVTEEQDAHNISLGKYKQIGPSSSHWLGVPLKSNNKTIGAIVIQTYDGTLLTEHDKSVMEFCSSQIAIAIERENAEDGIRAFKSAADSANIGLMMVNKQKKIQYINSYLASKLGYSIDELRNKFVSIFFTNKSANVDKMIDELINAKDELREIKTVMMSKSGEEIPYLINAVKVNLHHEKDFVLSFSCFNMANQKNREEALNRYANRLEILHKIDEAILESGTIDDIIRTALHVVQQLVKYDHASIIEINDKHSVNIYEGILNSNRFLENIRPNHPCSEAMNKSLYLNDIRMLKTSEDIQDAYESLCLSKKDLQTCIIMPLIAKHENIGQFVVGFCESDVLSFELSEIIKEVSKMISIGIYQTRLYERVETMATIDELTGIYNRRQLIELGEHTLSQVKRTDGSLSVIIFDIDYFKDVNDNYGHITGDNILKKIVNCCKKNVRKIDIFGRYGGDEFVVILPETGLEQVQLVANRLNTNVFENKELLEECPIQLSISVGVALLEDKNQTLTQLINHADEAMYEAKKSGRNRIVLYKNSPF
jgi:diguanylate cyclase (GGDEF)-like protein/PAS domain S-box-containing protein